MNWWQGVIAKGVVAMILTLLLVAILLSSIGKLSNYGAGKRLVPNIPEYVGTP